MTSLNQKVVGVTGAGRGLCAAFDLSLAEEGCELVLCGRRDADHSDIRDMVIARCARA